MSESRVHIWSSGHDFLVWEDNNCDRCVKRDDCEISDAISFAIFDDGTFAPEIAARLGYAGDCYFFCAERQTEPTPPKTAAQEMAEAGVPMLPGFGVVEERR